MMLVLVLFVLLLVVSYIMAQVLFVQAEYVMFLRPPTVAMELVILVNIAVIAGLIVVVGQD